MTEPTDPLLSSLESLGLSQPAQAKKPRNSMGQQEFFDLMVTQLKNQDPLKPLDSSEFLGQMAQFSTVTGLQNVEKSITELSSAFQSSQALQASTLVGRNVLVAGSQGLLPADGVFTAAADLPQSTGELTANFYDGSGQLVRRLSLGAHDAGLVQFAWDGIMDGGQRAPAGVYGVSVNAVLDGETVALDTLTAAQIESVTLGQGGAGMQLNLAGLGSVGLSEIKQLL
jgi:flagellar basal-body rod modification protein FlgD